MAMLKEQHKQHSRDERLQCIVLESQNIQLWNRLCLFSLIVGTVFIWNELKFRSPISLSYYGCLRLCTVSRIYRYHIRSLQFLCVSNCILLLLIYFDKRITQKISRTFLFTAIYFIIVFILSFTDLIENADPRCFWIIFKRVS